MNFFVKLRLLVGCVFITVTTPSLWVRTFRQLFCQHQNKVFIRNLYGDEVIFHGYKRSMWCCKDCGNVLFGSEIFDDKKDKAFFTLGEKNHL